MEQVDGGYGEGSVRRREPANERTPKRRPDEFELFERYSKPLPKKVREDKSEESTKVYNFSSELPQYTTAGVLDSGYRPSPEYDWKMTSTYFQMKTTQIKLREYGRSENSISFVSNKLTR